MRAARRTFTATLPALLIALAVIGTPLLALTEPVRGNQVAAIFPPGWDEADVLLASAAADSSIVRFGALPNIGIVLIEDETTLAALRQNGAWLLLHPQALGGCLILPRTDTLATDLQTAPSSHWSST